MFTQEETRALFYLLDVAEVDAKTCLEAELGWRKKARSDELEYWRSRIDALRSIRRKLESQIVPDNIEQGERGYEKSTESPYSQ